MSVTDPPVVSLDRVSRIFRAGWRRRVRAVDGLSLEVLPGEIFGLLGPNGSGKTTTLQMVLGLLAPTSGRLSVFGLPPGARSVRRRLGYLPEEFSGYDFLSGEEALRFYGGFFGLPRREVRRRAEELLQALDLWQDRKRRLREYSKGMRRRIGLAQSLLHGPDLVVLDEPTNGLDPLGIRKVKTLLLDLRNQGRTIVISSHILSEMQDVCDRVAILHRGRALICGRLQDLLGRPGRHRLVVQGAPPAAADLRPRLAELGLTLEDVQADQVSLEEVFLRMVSSPPADGPGAPPAASAGADEKKA